MPWTPMQQAAIDKRHANILVSAAAGSGKTAVLTERVFNRIVGNEKEKGIDIDRFLIVTFTSAAAHEMKERIADKISKAIEALQVEEVTEETIEKTAYLERQLTLLPKASISTIHAFCLKCIKNYFTHLDIDPNIKVGNESELQVMKMDILEEMLEDAFNLEDNNDFMELAETYGSIRGLEPLMELILDLHAFSKSTIFPNEWLEEKSHLEGDRWKQELLEDIFENLIDLTKVYEEALKVACQAMGPALYEPTLKDDLEQIKAILELPREHTKDITEAIYNIQFGRLPSKKQECDESLKERVKAYRELAKDVVKSAQGVAKLLNDPYLEDKTKKASKLMQTLVECVKAFDERFSEAKKDKGLLDYNDLEHMCLKLFVKQEVDETGQKGIVYTEVAKELADFYEEIYIDEYQDSNAVQETLLGAIALAKADGPTRFMVGDMKQSIYRFRLANPLIFADKYHCFSKYEDESDAQDICIDLSQNFRSRHNILEATNDLFSQIMSERVGELTYDEDAKLKVGNLYDSGDAQDYSSELAGAVELCLVETGNIIKEVETENETLAGESTIQELKNIELEALMVAKKIGALLRGEGNPQVVYDKELDQYRKIEPKDIVILLRSVQDKANIFEEALLREGIDAYADVSSNFFEAMEVQIMLSLLKIIDNPKQDIPLLTVLRSPIVGLDFDEILTIRKFEEEVDFYTAMCHYSETGAGSKTLHDFLVLLTHYREVAVLMTLEELMARLFIETGYYQYVGMLPAGAKKKANLKLLKKYAEDFEANSGVGLFAFLQYIDKLRASGAKIGEAKLVGASENLVSIMTIHKSKGLEFPIVFVCNVNKQFNNQDLMKNVLMHHELGLGPKYTDLETNILYETLPFEAIKRRITSENISEEMRVLYVALTRAKEKLFITGTVKDFNKEVQKWSQFAVRQTEGILPLGLKKSPSYLNWIGMSLFAHSKFETLRNTMGMNQIYLFKGEGEWDLTIMPAQKLIEEQQTIEEKVETRELMLDNWNVDEAYSEHRTLIYKRLGYSYPYMKATTMPVKVTVSDLKKQAMLEEYEETKYDLSREDVLTEEVATENELSYSFDDKVIPRFMRQEESMQATVRGTLIHSVLEQIDLIQCKRADLIMAELDRLVSVGKLHEEAARIVDVCKLERMATSTMLERMEKSKHVWKEKAFVYLLPAHEVDETYNLEEEILLQGVVDTCFIEEEGLVIIDYKTDYVDGKKLKESINKIKKRYQVQIDLYARALSEITGLPVKEKCLYLYHIDEWVTLD